MPDINTFAGVIVPADGMSEKFSDFYETTFEQTSGRSEVDLCGMALMLLRLAKDKSCLERDVCDAIIDLVK